MIKVIPLKYYDGGFMTQAFAFGGSRDKEKCEDAEKYEVDNKLHPGANTQRYILFKGWCTSTYIKLEIQ